MGYLDCDTSPCVLQERRALNNIASFGEACFRVLLTPLAVSWCVRLYSIIFFLLLFDTEKLKIANIKHPVKRLPDSSKVYCLNTYSASVA